MAAEQWYVEDDEDSISGELIGYRVLTLTEQDYFEVDAEDGSEDKTKDGAWNAAHSRVTQLERMAEVAEAAPLLARAMRANMVQVLYLQKLCTAVEFLDSLVDLGWTRSMDCPAEVWINNITTTALKECQRLEIK